MRLVIVDSWFHWPPVGGAIRSVKELANRLSYRGIDVCVLSPNYISPANMNFRFTFKSLDLAHFTAPAFYFRIKRMLEKINPDVVFVTCGNLMKPYMMAASKGFPTVVRIYAYELLCVASYGILFRDERICPYNFIEYPYKCITCLDDKKRIKSNTGIVDRSEFFKSCLFAYPFYQALLKRSITNIDKYIVTSDYMKYRFSKIISPQKIEVIPDGVDFEVFSPHKKEGLIDEKVKKVTLPGRIFDPVKGLDVLIKAAQLLWKKREDFRIVVTGSGRNNLGTYPFVGSDIWLNEKDVPAMYARSHLVVVPSIWAEPFGLTALEGMSCGVPVIASRIGGLSEIIKDGENGILFRLGDHTELAKKIDQLLDDEPLRKKLGNHARNYVVQNYSWDKIVDRYCAVFQSLAKR